VFPRLARNTPRTKEARNRLDQGEISSREYEEVEMLERNRLSTISTAHSNCEFEVGFEHWYLRATWEGRRRLCLSSPGRSGRGISRGHLRTWLDASDSPPGSAVSIHQGDV
jgi:hypothetical protein